MRYLSALVLCSVTVVAGCGHHGGAIPAKMEVRSDKVAVRVHQVRGAIFKFGVENLTGDSMVINRDAVHLETAGGPRSRVPGGLMTEYPLLPHGVHDVDVKFPLEGLPEGSEVRVNFTGAITDNGQPVQIEPIPFTIK